ncbi:hypothetical protein COCC4DRAFT_152682 [Bipolaris maydis ATCC 48331]|uniref:MARVEL domain-containing protein n=1 Tax=Cochliobolus heterostrophus (strain C4 / ATCC 48331 / race T) TaxID=665024 RepID=N4WK62_COCH4|nr:uncharacterized protein COCC4DRAFT_152682 [Bipolaris maydis ATCC 48331]KAH7556208.1 hypothetical protein BM1_06734 [Bipolaris maydis]ENH99689.1 hypothetical protein COCC4DRAFT_152682 [Bipolaris maydis ATCC 48331]KAJ5029039.1 hypothetical protein J3E73DRAFT_183874 [Bipolaris maydis]KAJ5062234.1 hypothetical protein J3E74DRAFT_405491 [Bipolaris maydis]KAJ6192435.1 hypothetical protein J3E72DRAFT_203843 [Bipolaris maydis]
MSAFAAILSLRLSQGIFTVLNIGLSSYLVHELVDVTSDVTVGLVAACVSAMGIFCAPSTSKVMSTRGSNLYFAFAVDWVVSIFNLIALIYLGKFVTSSSFCQEKICTVAKLNTVLTGLNFSNWAATATYIGIQISKPWTKGTEPVPEMGKIQL